MILNLFLIGFPTSCHNFSSNFFIELSSDSVAIAGGGILLGFFTGFLNSQLAIDCYQLFNRYKLVELRCLFDSNSIKFPSMNIVFFLLPSFTEFFFLQFFKFFLRAPLSPQPRRIIGS